jgi:hypothetical protein
MGESPREAPRDQPSIGRRRVTVAEAAGILAASVEAIRGRIKRKTLEAEHTREGVFVYLDTDQLESGRGQTTGQLRHEPDALISAKDEAIATLREQLEAERRASEENRRIIAMLTSRIPELEAPASPRQTGGPETTTEPPERAESGSTARGVQSETSRPWWPWWKRVFRSWLALFLAMAFLGGIVGGLIAAWAL